MTDYDDEIYDGDEAAGSGLLSRYPFHYSTPPIEAATSFLWTSMDGVLVGPAVTEHGSPTSGVATPFVDAWGDAVTATRFDGVIDYYSAPLPKPTGDVSYFGVAGVSDLSGLAIVGNFRSARGHLVYTHSTNKIYGQVQGSGGVVTPNRSTEEAAYFAFMLSVDRDGSSVLYTTAGYVSTLTPGNSIGYDNIGIGANSDGTYKYKGDIVCVGVIDRAATADDWAQYQRGILGYAAATGPQDSTFTRATAAIHLSNTKYFMMSKGMPRVGDKGILIEGVRTNKCYNTVPSVTAATTGWTATGGVLTNEADTAAVLAAGLDPLGDNVFKLVNATGSPHYVYGGAVSGNTNKHSLSVFARSTGTAPRVGWYYDGTFTSVGNIGADLARVTYGNETPPSATEQFAIEVVDGATLWFTLPQLEEGPFCSTPIPNVATAASATRNRDDCTLGALPIQGSIKASFEPNGWGQATGDTDAYIICQTDYSWCYSINNDDSRVESYDGTGITVPYEAVDGTPLIMQVGFGNLHTLFANSAGTSKAFGAFGSGDISLGRVGKKGPYGYIKDFEVKV